MSLEKPNMTRRTLISGLASAAIAKPKSWKPKLGILGNFSEDNLDFAAKEGFGSIGLWANPKTVLDCSASVTSQTVDRVRSAISRSGLRLSVLGNTQNHIAPELDARARGNRYFQKVIELAGALGSPTSEQLPAPSPASASTIRFRKLFASTTSNTFRSARSTR